MFLISCFNFILQTEVTTVICGNKELKKLIDISRQLDTVKRVICMDDEIPVVAGSNSWTITSFSDVEKLGKENPVDAELPLSADIAVIMYTSGSTGLPKVSIRFKSCFRSFSLYRNRGSKFHFVGLFQSNWKRNWFRTISETLLFLWKWKEILILNWNVIYILKIDCS